MYYFWVFLWFALQRNEKFPNFLLDLIVIPFLWLQKKPFYNLVAMFLLKMQYKHN